VEVQPKAAHVPGLMMALEVYKKETGFFFNREINYALHDALIDEIETVTCEALDWRETRELIHALAENPADAAMIDALLQSHPKQAQEFLKRMIKHRENSQRSTVFSQLVSEGVSQAH
jgi:hypothetical protein